jgi:hypothetical protein
MGIVEMLASHIFKKTSEIMQLLNDDFQERTYEGEATHTAFFQEFYTLAVSFFTLEQIELKPQQL